MTVPAPAEDDQSLAMNENASQDCDADSLSRADLVWQFFTAALKAPSIRSTYDSTSRIYNDLFGKGQNFYADCICDAIQSKTENRFEIALDLGAGSGLVTEMLHAYADESLGLDFSFGMLRDTIFGPNRASYCQSDVMHLPLADAQFDLITSSGLLTHILPRSFPRMMSEVHRVCRPGGQVFLGMPALPWHKFFKPNCPLEPRKRDHTLAFFYNAFHRSIGMHESRCGYTRKKIRQTLNEMGFQVEFLEYLPMVIIHATKQS